MSLSYQEVESIKQTVLSEISTFNEDIITQVIHKTIQNIPALGTTDKIDLFNRVFQSIFGYGIIQPLLDQTDITEIMINGLKPIFIEKQGKIHQTTICFEHEEQLMQLIHKICTEVGREVNLGSPTLDARLKDGSRVNIVLNPVAINGPILTIRKFKKALSTHRELMATGMFDKTVSDLLETLVKSKYNLFICGSTGSGKTTVLNCLSSFIDPNERIITIEDAAEISLQHHENCVTLETRKAHQSIHAIGMSHLIKNALRMRPDRIIVGEVRGDEVIDMLQAMNTGHDGSMSTGHSNSPIDMLTRLEVIASSYSEINHNLIRRQIISAIDFIVFVEKLPTGERKIAQITEVLKNRDAYELNSIFDYLHDSLTHEEMKSRIQNPHKLRRYEAYETHCS